SGPKSRSENWMTTKSNGMWQAARRWIRPAPTEYRMTLARSSSNESTAITTRWWDCPWRVFTLRCAKFGGVVRPFAHELFANVVASQVELNSRKRPQPGQAWIGPAMIEIDDVVLSL